ncbi:hypothetical protein B296_00030213 [Ensete ventricosum]|uniref:Uncharacterized protein n=1 Tax=Ensete ventricosum TaxID=4639 RepID=A0A427AD28_ENSVE|nr:hypothetical protein B296_00030213 [Ensete ventricosum]
MPGGTYRFVGPPTTGQYRRLGLFRPVTARNMLVTVDFDFHRSLSGGIGCGLVVARKREKKQGRRKRKNQRRLQSENLGMVPRIRRTSQGGDFFAAIFSSSEAMRKRGGGLSDGVCHLLTNLVAYCNSNDSTYEMAEDDDFNGSEFHELLEDPEVDCESAELEEYGLQNDTQAAENLTHIPSKFLSSFLEGLLILYSRGHDI